MKIKSLKKDSCKVISLLMIMAVLLTICAGCGEKDEYSLRVAAVAPYVDEAKAQEYAKQIKLSDESSKTSMYCAVIPSPNDTSNDENPDPDAAGAEMAGSANALKISAMIAAKDLDVMICDMESAARFARSDSFYSLSEIFTEEELKNIPTENQISYTKLDADNNPTDELLPACGIDISGNVALSEFMFSEKIGVFVVGNAKDKDKAKEYVLQLTQ